MANVPELDDHIGIGWYEGENSTSEDQQATAWLVPEGSEIDFVSWIDNDTTIATGASLTSFEDPSTTSPITDIDFSENRDYVCFTYFAPEYFYETGITELAPYPGEYGFIDVPENAWYGNVVAQANEYGYMTGWDVWFFGPNQTLSRAMAATITYRLVGEPDLGADAPQVFPDVPADQWYSYPIYWAVEAVAWAAENGIMGLNITELNPQGNILRCEAAAMAVRAQPNGVPVG